ncbi:hypothetical protein [Pseudomonas sp. EA_15y_Pfl2_R67]|uniref:hypothetical protein n=1 Tax=Pseudomonas sp. EA_15y_Pfl2_R67 TaxID=3088687 RepID=UPI0030DAFABA
MTRNAILSQRCITLESVVAEKDKQNQSIEEKHTHARSALEHYRESIKAQRDQDLRRHETQLHEGQIEQRKLRETLALKQDELTRLNRDNERLLGESRQYVKTLRTQESRLETLTFDIQSLRLSEAKSAGVNEHLIAQLTSLRKDFTELQQSANQSHLGEQRALDALADLQAQNELLLRDQRVDAGEIEARGNVDTYSNEQVAPGTKQTQPQRE